MLIETLILPVMGVWVIVFAIIQTGAGAALLVGWRTRLAGSVAVGYLLVLTALGFTRFRPLLLASLLVATALGGRYASLDSITGRYDPTPPAYPTLSVPSNALLPATALLGVLLLVGIFLGIDPSADTDFLGRETLLMIGFLTVAAAVGLLESLRPDDGRSSGADSSAGTSG